MINFLLKEVNLFPVFLSALEGRAAGGGRRAAEGAPLARQRRWPARAAGQVLCRPLAALRRVAPRSGASGEPLLGGTIADLRPAELAPLLSPQPQPQPQLQPRPP